MNLSKTIQLAADHPAYAGHFPNFPVLPGAVLLDEVLQVIAAERGIDLNGWQIASAKFLGVVRPGDALRIEFDAGAADAIRFSVFATERKVIGGVLHER
jgi:3-hydroxymyristoyl/3-hydroxydecanoyl-(acyl carrier protein) dehydratase